jgi:hypothetical protein
LLAFAALALSAGLLLGAAPRVIAQAYRGESLPVLNAMIRGQAAVPVDHYLSLWRDLAMRILTVEAGIALLLALLSFPLLHRAVDRWLGPAPAASRMSRRHVIVASSVVLALVGLQLLDVAFQREDWPFSSYPMYAGRQGDRIAWLRVYGVTASTEFPLVPEHHLRPFDTARLNYSLSDGVLGRADQAAALERAMKSLYRLYETGRRGGEHGGPAVHALRLYHEGWQILPSLANKPTPEERRLLFELRVAD